MATPDTSKRSPRTSIEPGESGIEVVMQGCGGGGLGRLALTLCCTLLGVACQSDTSGKSPWLDAGSAAHAGTAGMKGSEGGAGGPGATGGTAGMKTGSAGAAGGAAGMKPSDAGGAGGAAGMKPNGAAGSELPGSDAGVSGSDASTADDDKWVTTWATTLAPSNLISIAVPGGFTDVTLRQFVRTTIGGGRIRVRLSNAFGTQPLSIRAAHVAIRDAESSIVASADRALLFSGAPSVSIPAGESRTSNPLTFDLPAHGDIAISLELEGTAFAETSHPWGGKTSYVAPIGFAGSAAMPVEWSTEAWYFVEGVDVVPSVDAAAIVALGDSITDGTGSTVDADRSWPDLLAQRLASDGVQLAVVNEGYLGNQILTDDLAPAAISRFDRDVLKNAGVTHVVFFEGINDIGLSGATSDAVIKGIRTVIGKARAAKLKIIGGTLAPFEDCIYYSPEGETQRQAVNAWIRTSDEFDGVIDFDKILADPSAPTRLRMEYDSGDHIHPNDAGYAAVAAAIDLSLFQ